MKIVGWLLLVAFLLFLSIVFYNMWSIVHPTKRTLQPYHHEWLEHPEAHSMDIEKHTSLNKTPYLIVRYNPNYPTSKRIRALNEQIEATAHNATLVLFHGKNGRKEDLLPVAERYIALGFTCILPDLPRHGESQTERLYYATTKEEQHYLDEVLDDASKHIQIENLAIWGMSLGGAFAIQSVAHSKYPFKAMVLVSTFDQLDGVLRDKSTTLFGSFLGDLLYQALEKSLTFFYHFNPTDANSAKIASILTLPLYMVHGKKDELIDYRRGERLFKSFASKQKQFLLDPDGDHHNILVTKAPFYAGSGEFLFSNAPFNQIFIK